MRTLELGSKGVIGVGKLSYDVAVYSLAQDDRVVQTSNPNGPPQSLFISAGQYEATGLESVISWHIDSAFSTTLTYSYIDAKWGDFTIPSATGSIDLTGKSPVGVPEYMAAFHVDYSMSEQLTGRLSYEYYADYFYTQNNSLKGGGYDLWNASVDYAVKQVPGLSINMSATNLLNNDYYYRFGSLENSTYVTPGVPRQVRLMMTYDF